jgi:coenzyme PQQ precursor peptide PqqA
MTCFIGPAATRRSRECRKGWCDGRPSVEGGARRRIPELYHSEVAMWNKPEYTEMRFGFEVTMYIANR